MANFTAGLAAFHLIPLCRARAQGTVQNFTELLPHAVLFPDERLVWTGAQPPTEEEAAALWGAFGVGQVAIIAKACTLYEVANPSMGAPQWLSADAINAEASGYFLVPRLQIPAGRRFAAARETDAVGGGGNVITTGYFSYDFDNGPSDDPLYLATNPWVRHGLTLSGIKWAFTSVTYFYFPITWLSLMLDQQIYAGNPAGFHLTNVLPHAANVVVLFLLCWRYA